MSYSRWVCPACQANNMPQSSFCFQCGARQAATVPSVPTLQGAMPRRPTPLWIRFVLAGIIICTGCAGCGTVYMMGLAANEFRTVTLDAKMKQVQVGMGTKKVREILGQPDSVQSFNNFGSVSETYYYGRWQLVFEYDTLMRVNRY